MDSTNCHGMIGLACFITPEQLGLIAIYGIFHFLTFQMMPGPLFLGLDSNGKADLPGIAGGCFLSGVSRCRSTDFSPVRMGPS